VTTPTAHLARDEWLDFCRSLAILLVLLSHGRHFLTPAWEFAAFFRIGGFLGVELFFVLSGFLVGRILMQDFLRDDDGQHWLRNFLARRWLRTLPVFYLFLAINLALIALRIAPGRAEHLLPFLLFMQNLAWPGPPEFGEAWSLSVEEIFYLLFPVCLFLAAKLSQDRRGVFVVVMLVLLIAPMLIRAFFVYNYNPTWDEGVRKVAVLRLDALMVGVLIGWLVQDLRATGRISRRLLAGSTLVSASLVVFLYFYLETARDSSLFYRTGLFLLTSACAALLLLSGHGSARLPKPVAGISASVARWSYALYLSHMPVIYLINYFWEASPAHLPDAAIRWISFILGSFGLAILVERLCERPILAWRDRTIPR